jgi:hypothetical protein
VALDPTASGRRPRHEHGTQERDERARNATRQVRRNRHIANAKRTMLNADNSAPATNPVGT